MNNRKLVTIIFPTRSRIDLLEKLLLSIEEKTFNKKWIEVISIYDYDDKETADLFYNISSKLTYSFKFIGRQQEQYLNLPNDYYSLGLKLASDPYFAWILGNDCEIITQDWDLILYKHVNHLLFSIEKNYSYFYITINDNTHWSSKGLKEEGNHYKHESCCFPILSFNYVNDFKEFFPIEMPTWGGDIALLEVAKFLPKFKFIYLNDKIEVFHFSPYNESREQDDSYFRMAERSLSSIEGVKENIKKKKKILNIK